MILGHSCSINQTLAGCQTAQPISSIDEKFLKKKLICGRTNGNTFLTTERADAKGKCEDGKVLCGKSTFKADNKICASSVDQCPITFVGFVADANLASYPAIDYTRVTFDTGITFVYSKNFDALPVTSFLVES